MLESHSRAGEIQARGRRAPEAFLAEILSRYSVVSGDLRSDFGADNRADVLDVVRCRLRRRAEVDRPALSSTASSVRTLSTARLVSECLDQLVDSLGDAPGSAGRLAYGTPNSRNRLSSGNVWQVRHCPLEPPVYTFGGHVTVGP